MWRPPLRREAIDASSVKECPSASMDTRAPPPASSFTASPTSSSPVASDRLGRSLLFSLGELLRVDADREFGLTAELRSWRLSLLVSHLRWISSFPGGGRWSPAAAAASEQRLALDGL